MISQTGRYLLYLYGQKRALRVKLWIFSTLNMWNMKFLAKVELLQFWVGTIPRVNICILSCQKVLIKWKQFNGRWNAAVFYVSCLRSYNCKTFSSVTTLHVLHELLLTIIRHPQRASSGLRVSVDSLLSTSHPWHLDLTVSNLHTQLPFVML